MKPVGRLGTERKEPGTGDGALLLKVETAEDLRVAGDELVALVQLLTTDHTDEAADMVDPASGSHHQFV